MHFFIMQLSKLLVTRIGDSRSAQHANLEANNAKLNNPEPKLPNLDTRDRE